jgi:heavy metal sensor kinase
LGLSSIRERLFLIYTFVLVGTFLLFGIVVYYLPRVTLRTEIDRRLLGTAEQILEESHAVASQDAVEFVISQELSVFEKANTFYVVTDPEGEVILSRSDNLEGFEGPLDPAGFGDEDPDYHTVTIGDQELRVLTYPLYTESGYRNRLAAYLQLATVVDDYNAFERLLIISLLVGAASVTASLFVLTLVTPGLFRPLEDIAVVARQITRADDLSRRVPDTGRKDEIGDLTIAFNQTLERLENLFRTQQRFLADVSHELRTPLTTIRGNVDLMRRMDMVDPEFLNDIQAELERMTRLVNDLLMLARADVGSVRIMREPVEIDSVVIDVYRQVAMVEQPVTIKLNEVDQAYVLGDRDRLKQLLLNLVDNAIKYTPEGGEVRMGLSKSEDRVHIYVADNGIGISEEDLPHIFDRFFRVDKARSRAMGGTGLGLSIVRSVVEAHGGDIHVTSKAGEGTTFYVSLPLYVLPSSAAGTGSNGQQTTIPSRPVAGLRARKRPQEPGS